MQDYEITLARAYLAASGNDPIAALIRSVKDLASAHRQVAGGSPPPSASIRLTRARLREAA